MQSLAPACFEIAFDSGLPGFTHRIVRAQARLVQQCLEDVVRCLSAVERIDQRLHDGNRSVVGARIGPGLKRVRGGNVPVGDRARLVHVRTEMGDDLCLVEGRGELEIGWHRVDGVGIQNHKPIHLPGIQIGNQRLNIAKLIARQRKRGLAGDDRSLAGVAQRGVDRPGHGFNRPILIEPWNHDALARVSLQVLGQRSDKLLLFIGPVVARGVNGNWRAAHRLRQLRRKRRDFAGAQAQPMLRLQPSRRRRGLDRIKPVQILGVLAPLCIFANQLMESGIACAGKKIRIERDNHISIGQRILRRQAAL